MTVIALEKNGHGYFVMSGYNAPLTHRFPKYLRASGMWCNLCAPDCYRRWAMGHVLPLIKLAVRTVLHLKTEDFGYRCEDFYPIEKLATGGHR